MNDTQTKPRTLKELYMEERPGVLYIHEDAHQVYYQVAGADLDQLETTYTLITRNHNSCLAMYEALQGLLDYVIVDPLYDEEFAMVRAALRLADGLDAEEEGE